MKPKNRGHATLLRLTRKRGQKAEAARVAGVRPNQITQWRSGLITPSGPNRTKLERLGILSNWWDKACRKAT